MPPLHEPQPLVPVVTVELTPALIRHYLGYFHQLRELFILRGEAGAAMECNKRLDWLLDEFPKA